MHAALAPTSARETRTGNAFITFRSSNVLAPSLDFIVASMLKVAPHRPATPATPSNRRSPTTKGPNW